MEHRYYPRMQVTLEVDLYKRNLPLGRALTKDVSLGGMMLQNERPVLDRNDMVSIRLWMNGVEQTLRGLVVYSNQQYVGIMLIDMDKELARTFFNFLKELEAPKKAAFAAFGAERGS